MGRTRGARGADFAAKRNAMLDRIGAYLADALPSRPSFREIAARAGVSVPTLRHYLGNREDLLVALMERQAAMGEPYVAAAGVASGDLDASIRALVSQVVDGLFRYGVADIHAVGVAEGAGSGRLGPAYLVHLLEPTLASVERRLAHHAASGELRSADLRVAALMLISPLYLAALHQTALAGSTVRPLEVEALADEVTAAFLRAYGADREPG
jgi:AcrR family transcriptional regulator